MGPGEINKGNFSQFGLTGRIQILELYGKCIFTERRALMNVYIYSVGDFYVLASGPTATESITAADVLWDHSLLGLFIK